MAHRVIPPHVHDHFPYAIVMHIGTQDKKEPVQASSHLPAELPKEAHRVERIVRAAC